MPAVDDAAAAARSLGFDGLAFDQELYPQNDGRTTASWQWDYPGNQHSEAETRAKVRERGEELMRSILSAYPSVDILAYFTMFPGTWDEVVQEEINHIERGLRQLGAGRSVERTHGGRGVSEHHVPQRDLLQDTACRGPGIAHTPTSTTPSSHSSPGDSRTGHMRRPCAGDAVRLDQLRHEQLRERAPAGRTLPSNSTWRGAGAWAGCLPTSLLASSRVSTTGRTGTRCRSSSARRGGPQPADSLESTLRARRRGHHRDHRLRPGRLRGPIRPLEDRRRTVRHRRDDLEPGPGTTRTDGATGRCNGRQRDVPLHTGSNTVTITVEDTHGLRTVKTVKVVR